MRDLAEESVNIDRYYKSGKLLDLGCFKGISARLCVIGAETKGVDISGEAIEFGRKNSAWTFIAEN